MSMTMTFVPSEPQSSGEIQIVSPERATDVETKHQQVADFLDTHKVDALLLQKPSNFAWFTAGGDNSRRGSSNTTASLFITPDARVLVTSNVDSGLIFDHELPTLGFQLKERPWHESRNVLIEDLCRGRKVASDTGIGSTIDATSQIGLMRLPLTEFECTRIRELGREVAHAVEATARNFEHRQTEAEIAGELTHRLIRHEVIPERIQVWADGQGHRYRHWAFGSDRVERYCVISVVGRKGGLCAGAARTVCFNSLPDTLKAAHIAATLMQATGMYFSKADWPISETWKRVERIYEKYGYPEEWQFSDQAELIGYEPCEIPIVPQSDFMLQPGMALCWHPSIGPSIVGDTILLTEKGYEVLTPMEGWPKVKVDVKQRTVSLPDVLRREP